MEIVHENVLSFWEFKDALLTNQICPWALLTWLARAVTDVFGAGSILLHSSGAYFGRVKLIF